MPMLMYDDASNEGSGHGSMKMMERKKITTDANQPGGQDKNRRLKDEIML